jgi:DNA-binding response OmpR family regulator
MQHGPIAELLVEAGCVPRHVVQEVLARGPFVGGARVDDDLIGLALEHEAALSEWIAEKSGAPAVVLSTSTLDLAAVRLVGRAVIEHHRVLPLLSDNATLTLAAPRADVASLLAPLEAATGQRVVVVVAVECLLDQAIAVAVARAEAGEAVLVGPKSLSPVPTLQLARAPMRVRLPRADSVAKALGAVLDEAIERAGGMPAGLLPQNAARLGALRLKQVAVPKVAVTEAPRAIDLGPFVPRVPRVVVVEDDDSIRALIVRVLQHDGCDVDEARDGQAAAELFRARGRPDLIVLDALLPDVHGFELCGAIKASPAWSSTPVIMISAVFKGFESARSIQEVHGADAFLEKPFEVQQFRLIAAELLKRTAPPLPAPTSTMNSEAAQQAMAARLAAGDVASALGVVDAWLQVDPFNARAWLERGNLSLHEGDDAAALRAYELASTYGAREFLAHWSLAMMYERLGFTRRARATWEKAAAASPDPVVAERIREQLAAL